MGFGIALIGYAFLLLNEMGGGIFAALLMGYGFFLASRLNAKFAQAAVSVLFMFPRGVVLALDIIGVINITELTVLNTVTQAVHLIAWFLVTYFWLNGVMEIARDNKAEKLESQARARLILTAVFLIGSLFITFLTIGGVLQTLPGEIAMGQYILQYVLIFYNLFFLHTCFILITSEKQYEKDRHQIAQERAKALEKKHKEQQEVKNRIGKR